jgi:hypothetical protein
MERFALRRTVPTLALITGLAVIPDTAIAASPTKFHNHSTGSFSTTVCGIPVDVNFINTSNFFLNADGSFKLTYSITDTFTNPVNGAAVNVSGTGQETGQAIVNQQANTVTFTTTYKGLPEKIQTANGPVLTRDAGFIEFVNTFDLTTGDLISAATVINKGPHPEADSNFALFCEVITEALS